MGREIKILVTGANGFIGKNLTVELKNRGYQDVFCCDRETTEEELRTYVENSDFIFHLAGINRPEKVEEFKTGNTDFTETLLTMIEKTEKKIPLLLSSSIQAAQDNPYGNSKLAAEEAVHQFGKEHGIPMFVYRLANVFGKWCRPNYNSVVATFCHNIAHNLPITINAPEAKLTLVYIDDVVDEFIRCMEEELDAAVQEKASDAGVMPAIAPAEEFYSIPVWYQITLQELADTLYSFKESRENLQVPDMGDEWTKKLYSTYLSYLPEDGFSYPLKMNVDERGSFTEFLRTSDRGQVSINIAKPGITKGNHWHHTKNEKFLVVKGEGLIQFRKLGSEEIIEYRVSGSKLEVIDIPTGYTHNIVNVGTEDMVTVMWVNEAFNPEQPDTYFEQV